MKLVVFILFALIELIISCRTCGNYCLKYCNGHSYACGKNNVCRVYKII